MRDAHFATFRFQIFGANKKVCKDSIEIYRKNWEILTTILILILAWMPLDPVRGAREYTRK